MVRTFSRCAGLLAPLLLARTTGAAVWTVSPPGGGGQFTTIQGAINAAAPGDTVLVLAGSYGPFVLNKAIRMLGAGPSLVTVTGPQFVFVTSPGTTPVAITGVPAGGFALVAGMKVVLSGTGPGPCQNPFTTGPMAVPAVSVTNCAGRVVLSNLDIRPGFLGRGIQATSSAGLILDHLIVATSPFTCGTPLFPCCEAPCFGEAIWTAGADVSLNDSSVLGIAASSALQVDGPAQALVARTALQGAEGVTVSPCGISGGYVGLGGGDGLEATSGAIVRISAGPGALAAGGDGAQGSCTCPTCVSGPGGHAIFASAASVLRAPDLPLLPGPGAGSPPCNGAPGSGSFGSTVTVAASPLPSLGVVPVLASPGGAVGLDVRGARGSLYVVGAADAPGFQSIAGVGGPLLLDPATLVVAFSGTLGPSGSAAIFTAVPPDPSISTAVLFLQPATMDPSGVSLGPAVPFVVL